MNQEEFWRLVDSTREASQGDKEAHCELIKNTLSALSEQEILDYDEFFEEFGACLSP